MKNHYSTPPRGFALCDLCAVTASILLLAMIAPAVLARNKGTTLSLTCLNNQQQLIKAWTVYAEANEGVLVGNYHGGDAQGGAAGWDPSKAPWASGWLDWGSRSDNTNSLYVNSSQFSRLAPYYNDAKIVKCPADNHLSPLQRSLGWKERVRSVSLNMGLGWGNAATGPWDSLMYAQIRKLSELRFPSPAETFVFMDEHPDSINDPGMFSPRSTSWVDVPGSYHQGGAGTSFADGHAIIHRWKGPISRKPVTYGGLGVTATAAGKPDITWMSYHSPRVSTRSY